MLDCSLSRTADGLYVLAGGERHLLVSEGASGAVASMAFEVQDGSALERLRDRLEGAPGGLRSASSPLFADGAFGLSDPQGRRIVFGTARAERRPDERPGRLQHVVFQTTALAPLLEFYVGRVGFEIGRAHV